ncbi:MAG: hypothetical protein ACK4PR_12530 [Gammaproteobacteria bacterium]
MSSFFDQIKIYLLVTLIAASSYGCTEDVYSNTPVASNYANGITTQTTNDLVDTPNFYSYYIPINFGHQDKYINSANTETYQPPNNIYKYY